MTDREKAIVMAYTGIVMLAGNKIDEYYKYLAELYGRPVYTHEIPTLDITSKAKRDFIMLCNNEQQSERKRGKWEEVEVIACAYDIDGVNTWASKMRCNQCAFSTYAIEGRFAQYNYCPHCGADMRGDNNATD